MASRWCDRYRETGRGNVRIKGIELFDQPYIQRYGLERLHESPKNKLSRLENRDPVGFFLSTPKKEPRKG